MTPIFLAGLAVSAMLFTGFLGYAVSEGGWEAPSSDADWGQPRGGSGCCIDFSEEGESWEPYHEPNSTVEG